MSTDVVGAVHDQPLVDTTVTGWSECHGVVRAELDRPGFEALISEGETPPAGATNFDTSLGLAIRRHCALLLDLSPRVLAEEYLARRSELGAAQVTRRLLGATGTVTYCMDTGFRPEGSPDILGGSLALQGREEAPPAIGYLVLRRAITKPPI